MRKKQFKTATETTIVLEKRDKETWIITEVLPNEKYNQVLGIMGEKFALKYYNFLKNSLK